MPQVNIRAGRIDWAAVKRRLHESEANCAVELRDPRRMQDVFRQRAALLAARQPAEPRESYNLQALTFALGDERFALPLSALVETLPLTNCTPVPGGPRALTGVINLRGEIRAVIDLMAVLGIEASQDVERPRGYILVMHDGGQELGLRVDRLESIVSIALDALQAPTAEGSCAKGCARGATSDRLILLDPAAVLTRAARLNDAASARNAAIRPLNEAMSNY